MTTGVTEMPALHRDVVVHAPEEDGAPWVVRRPDRTLLRVGADMGRLLAAVDGRRTAAQIADLLGGPWTTQEVEGALAAAAGMHLLVGTEVSRRRRRPEARVQVVPPMTVQLTLFRPQRLARRLQPLLRAVPSTVAVSVVVAVAAGGLLALAVQGREVRAAIGTPMPLWVLVVILVGTLTVTGLHELGHGLTLARYGGTPSRIGIMLFYLTPVFFCDVSDGWRLPHNRQRVAVAFAGIGTQVLLAGVIAVAAAPLGAVTGNAQLHEALLLLAVATYVAAVLNLVPLVKFDGYIALMTHVDVPHLRSRAMTDARRALGRVLFGGRRRDRELPRVPWAVAFGLGCMVFPLYLIGTALGLWSDLLISTGAVGQVVLVAVVAYVGFAALRGLGRTVEEARAGGAHPLRIVAGGVAVAGVAAAALTLVSVPYTVDGGYDCTGATARVVLADGSDVTAVAEGAPVILREQGLLAAVPVGSAVVAAGGATRGEVPLDALFPVSDVGHIAVDVWEVPMTSCADLAPDASRRGAAVVDAGHRPLGQWLVATFLAPAFR